MKENHGKVGMEILLDRSFFKTEGCFQLSAPGISVCVHEKEPGKGRN